MNRLLIPSAVLLWGLQISFLSPALALILTGLYGASTAEIGWVLAIYNASGFLCALVIPAAADRRRDYLRPMLLCAVLTVALAIVLAVVTTLPLAVLALVLLGGPAGIGNGMLFAHLRHSGAAPETLIRTRAIVSVAWVAGPPLTTALIGLWGVRSVLGAVAVIAVLVAGTAVVMLRENARAAAAGAGEVAGTAPEPGSVPVADGDPEPESELDADAAPRTDPAPEGAPASAPAPEEEEIPLPRGGIALITAAFVLLQATNATGMTIMTVYVLQTVGLDLVWAGVALGVAAGLEVPALLGIGRLTTRFSSLGLLATSCLAGIAYYLGLAAVTGPVLLLALQVLNARAFAGISGVGLPLFQQLIPRPGLSTGLYLNTRRIGAIVTGPIIAIGAVPVLGQRGIFLACAVLTALALSIIVLARRAGGRRAARA